MHRAEGYFWMKNKLSDTGVPFICLGTEVGSYIRLHVRGCGFEYILSPPRETSPFRRRRIEFNGVRKLFRETLPRMHVASCAWNFYFSSRRNMTCRSNFS